MDNLEKIAVILSFTSVISIIIRGVDNMKNENRKNVGTIIKIYKNKIKIDTIDQVLRQISYAWVVVFLIYAAVLYLMKDIESIPHPLLMLLGFAAVQNFLVADTIRNIAAPKLENSMIGYTVEDKGEEWVRLDTLNKLSQVVALTVAGILLFDKTKYTMSIGVVLIVCGIALLGCRIYRYLIIDHRNLYIKSRESTYLSLELPPEASLNKVYDSDYKAYFQIFLSNSRPETYDLFEYEFSIEQDGNVVVVYDYARNVKAMYNSKDVRHINIKVGKSKVFNTEEKTECIQSTVWYKKK